MDAVAATISATFVCKALLQMDGIHTIFQVQRLQPADVVNLGYVLNVIESPSERDAVLRKALQLAQRLLIVAVRVDQGPQWGEAFNDGLITTRNGFQKLYTQAEFRALSRIYTQPPSGHGRTWCRLHLQR